jgi:hypothetical protein
MSRKTYLIVALTLLALSSAAVWLNAHDESVAEALMKRAAAAWELDTGRYKSVGIQSIRGGVVVRRWEHSDGRQTDVIDVTFVEGLVCYSKINNASSQYRNIGCVHYPAE